MAVVEKISDITASSVADYLRIAEPTESDTNYINTLLSVAKDYICKYTGIAEDDLDDYTDLIIVVYVLCQDMYDNRSNYVDNDKPNQVVETILGLHTRNNL